MAKHTPGPWRVCHAGDFVLVNSHSPTTGDVARRICAEEHPSPIDIANAQLIAAAPRMLAALKRVLATYGEPDFDVVEAAFAEVRDAIVEADGSLPPAATVVTKKRGR